MVATDNSAWFDGYITIREEVVLRTACGCEKILSAPRGQHAIRVQLQNARDRFTTDVDVRYSIRQFVNGGRTDQIGRPVYEEWLNQQEQEDWKHEYQKLYNDVYGMDTGL